MPAGVVQEGDEALSDGSRVTAARHRALCRHVVRAHTRRASFGPRIGSCQRTNGSSAQEWKPVNNAARDMPSYAPRPSNGATTASCTVPAGPARGLPKHRVPACSRRANCRKCVAGSNVSAQPFAKARDTKRWNMSPVAMLQRRPPISDCIR